MRPYGYETDRVTIRESEAQILKSAAESVINGESLRSVAKELNERGARTVTGNLWDARLLRRVLESPRVAGKRKDSSGKTRSAGWPAILDDLTHKRLVALFREKAPAQEPVPSTRQYLLTSGIAVCGLCGKRLGARPNNSGRRSYACITDPPYSGCGRIRIVAEAFENDVAERALARLLRGDNRDQLQAAVEAAHKRAEEAKNQLRDADRRRRQAGEMFADGGITAKELKGVTARTKEIIAEARAAIRLGERLEGMDAVSASSLVAWWEHASVEQQSAFLELLIESVEVHPVLVRGSKLYDPSRIKINWR